MDEAIHTVRVDVREELQAAPIGGFHVRIGAMLALILLFDGYDLYTASYIVHYVTPQWGLSSSRIGVMLSAGLAGFAAGSAVSGLLGDRFGRRKVLLSGCALSGLLSLAIAVSVTNFSSFVILRLAMGLALGLLMPIAVTYINEVAPSRSANLFTICFFSLGWIGGAGCCGLVAVWLTPRYGWQSLYFVGAFGIVLAGVLWMLLPESAIFLASRGRFPEVQALLIRFWPARAAKYSQAEMSMVEEPVHRGSLATLFAPKYRRRTVCFWSMGALSLFASYGLSGWLPTIMLERGESLATSFAYGSTLSLTSLFGGLIEGAAADRLSDRRLVLSVSWVLGAAAVALLACSTARPLALLGIVAAGMFLIGPQFVLNNLVANSYPTEVRSTGVGMFLGLARVGAMFGPAIAGVTRQLTGGPGLMFVTIGGALVLASLIVFVGSPPSPQFDVAAVRH